MREQKEQGGGAPKQQKQRSVLPQPLVWQRRQEMPPQQATTGPALMEEVKRLNVVVVKGQEQGIGALSRDSYAMEVNRGRNCYACGGFGHMARHCRNWRRGRVAEGRRLEYAEGRIKGNIKHLDHLKGVENLESLD